MALNIGSPGTAATVAQLSALRVALGADSHYPSAAALAAAVTVNAAVWVDGRPVSVAGESPAAIRRYSSSLGHARTVVLPNATIVLPFSTSLVYSTVGLPASSVGVTGDSAYDDNGTLYTKGASGWADANTVAVSASRTLLSSDIGKRLLCSSTSPIVLTLPSTLGYLGAAPIEYLRLGTGAVSVVAATSPAATLYDPLSLAAATPQYLSGGIKFLGVGVAVVAQ